MRGIQAKVLSEIEESLPEGLELVANSEAAISNHVRVRVMEGLTVVREYSLHFDVDSVRVKTISGPRPANGQPSCYVGFEQVPLDDLGPVAAAIAFGNQPEPTAAGGSGAKSGPAFATTRRQCSPSRSGRE